MEDNSDQLFKEGKKLYIVGNYSKALEFLSKACKIREKHLGHLHDSMYEVYYFLAKGYYMFSKNENELIGDGLEIDKDKEQQNDSNVDDIHESEVVDSEEKLIKEGDKVETVEPSGSTEIDHDDSDDNQDKENLTYLQLAYETIECAKLVLRNQLEDEEKKKEVDRENLEIKMADCCDLVGNIYLEEGVINEAICEYEKALEFRRKHLTSYDRSIAESYYNLGVAFGVDMRPGEAARAYQQCREVMVKCQSFEGGSKATDLEAIIADLDEKINDCKEGERDYALAKESIKQFMMTASSPNQAVTTSDLTPLLRRKTNTARSSGAAPEEPPASKRKLE